MTQPFIRCGLILLGLLGGGLTSAVADEAPFYWEYIHVEMELRENGDLLITEEQKYAFTGPHSPERYRAIALDKVDEITHASVSQGGTRLSASTTRKRGTFQIRWSHRLTPPESHTFTLRYLVKGGLRVYEQTDMVEWRALFADREASIQRGKVRLTLPPVLSGHPQEIATWGTSADMHRVSPTTVEWTTHAPLPPGEGLNLRVSFPHGLVTGSVPGGQSRDHKSLEGVTAYVVGGVILILSVVGLMIGKRAYRVGRGELGPIGRAEIGFGADGGGGLGCGGNGGDSGGNAGG